MAIRNISGDEIGLGFRLFQAATADLLTYRRSLDPGLSDEEVRQKMVAKAEEDGLLFLRRLPIVRDLVADRDMWLSDEAHGVVDAVLEGRETLKVGDLIHFLEMLVPWEAWLLDYIERSLEEEHAPDAVDLLGGQVFRRDIPMGNGTRLPVLISIATPFTPKTEWLRKVRYRFEREFAPMVSLRPESLALAGRCLGPWMQELTSEEIADQLLTEEGYPDHIVADTELKKDQLYSQAVGRRAKLVRKLKGRFLATVTKVVVPKSQAR